MVSCEIGRYQDEGNIHHDYQHQNVLDEVREVNDLKEILLDEDSVVNFPIQENDHIKWINIPESISLNHCKKFGLELLGFGRTLDVDSIVEQHQDLACEMILFKWLNMEGASNEPITFQTLIKVIHKLGEKFGNGYIELANKIKFTAEVHQTIDIGYIPAPVKTYSSQLFERYQKDNVIDISQWIPKRLDQKIQNITFVDLELKEHNTDDFVELDDLLRDIQDGMKILFTGRPGVGKTTITRYLSKHKFNKRFFLIIKLHLGTFSDLINDLDTLLKIHGDKFFPSVDIARMSSFIQRTNGKGVCFLLDGYDKYVPSRHGNYINSLIKGKELAKSVVIVTSRPSAVEDIMNLFQRKIEIIGFAETRINTYLRQLQLPDAENKTVFQYLDNHPKVKQMCYLPLHLSMLVFMIITDGNAVTLLNTETDLYYNFLALTIKHYESVRHERAVESLKECFSDPNTQTDLCDILRNISKISLDGMLWGRTQMFTSSSLTRLSRIDNVSAEIEALSLFKIETSYDKDGIKLYKYWYSHPTFQEFLAAFHLTTLPSRIQFDYMHRYDMDEVYKYFFGLIRSMSNYDDTAIMTKFITFARTSYYRSHRYNDFYMIKCAHEAGGSDNFISYLKAAGIISQSNSLHVYLGNHDNDDCWYLGYILAQTSLNQLNLQVDYFTNKWCSSFVTRYLKNARFSDVNVAKLIIEKGIFLKSYKDILDDIDPEFLSVFQQSLTHFKLSSYIHEVNSLLKLERFLKYFYALQSLSLQVDVRVIQQGYLEKVLQNLTLLRYLELTVTDYFNVCYFNATACKGLLKFSKLKQLQSLMLEITFELSLSGLKGLNNLETLSMYDIYNSSNINSSNIKKLLLGIQEVHSLKKLALNLNLRTNTTDSIKEVAKALEQCTRWLLINLTIDASFFSSGENDVIELAYGLGNLTKLQELSLYLNWELHGNNSNDKGAIVLADKLKHLHNLHTLKLHLICGISCDELTVIFRHLNLKNLDLEIAANTRSYNIKKLLNELKNLKLLQKLVLSRNKLYNDDMETLTLALKEMNNLHTLDLSHNHIGDDGMKLLAELFDSPQQYLGNLKVLLLNGNQYSEVGAKILAEILKKFLQLQTIEFNRDLIMFSAEVLSLRHQQNIRKIPVILPQQPSPISETSSISFSEILNFVFEQFYLYNHYNYYVFSVIFLGLVVLVRVSMFFKSKASSNKIMQSTELSRALTYSSFSVSDAWYLKRLESMNLDGTGTVIAILDTTIDQTFPCFTKKKILHVANNESFPSLTEEEILVIDCLPGVPVASDLHATMHGTICSAIAVGSQCDTTSGVIPRGVAPGAQLIVYRIAEGKHIPFEAIERALDDIWNRLQSNIRIDVVSISYHFEVTDEQLEILREKIQKLTEIGITFVAAAGNNGLYQDLACIPAHFDYVISVGALDKHGKKSLLTPHVKIDVYAPGDDLKFATSDEIFWGTSYATPAAAGLVLLLKQWANFIGSPAKENIHRAEILRKIFKHDMYKETDSTDKNIDPLEPIVRVNSDDTVMVFQPATFFMDMKKNPTMLNVIVQKYLPADEDNMMDH